MRIFYWVAGVLIALTAFPSLGYFIAYGLTGEDGCQRRAIMFYRWASMLSLLTFNIVLYKYVLLAFLALFH